MSPDAEPITKVRYEFLERPWGTLMVAIADPDDPRIKAHREWCLRHIGRTPIGGSRHTVTSGYSQVLDRF
jgi:hypothetical protein